MRIVYILTSLGVGGAERQALWLAERMAQRNHQVVILVLCFQLKEEWETALPVVRLGIRKSPVSLILGIWRAVRFLWAFRPRVVHSHSFHANMLGRLATIFIQGAVQIATIHNVYEGGLCRMLAYRFSDSFSNRTIAVSEAVKAQFVRHKALRSSRCSVICNGIDLRLFTSSEKRRLKLREAMQVESQFIWLTVGRIVSAKDYPNLLNAFAMVSRIYPEARLWIAGGASKDATEQLQALIVERGISGNVNCLGLYRDIPALMDAADGFVLASAWEGMPLVVGEAMAMKKPIVATDVGGTKELLRDTGSIVPSKNSEALAKAMLEVMRRSTKSNSAIGKAARARINTAFCMDAQAVKWEQLYQHIATNHSANV